MIHGLRLVVHKLFWIGRGLVW